ncbi:sirohydrochlorin chelatase [Actinoplanes sp. CA-054009]
MRSARLTVLLVAHGSRDPRAAASTEALARAVRRARPRWDVRASYLDHAGPRPLDVLAALPPGSRAVVVPLLLTAAYHGRVDVPAVLAAATHLPIDVTLAHVLGPTSHEISDSLLDGLISRLTAATGGHGGAGSAGGPAGVGPAGGAVSVAGATGGAAGSAGGAARGATGGGAVGGAAGVGPAGGAASGAMGGGAVGGAVSVAGATGGVAGEAGGVACGAVGGGAVGGAVSVAGATGGVAGEAGGVACGAVGGGAVGGAVSVAGATGGVAGEAGGVARGAVGVGGAGGRGLGGANGAGGGLDGVVLAAAGTRDAVARETITWVAEALSARLSLPCAVAYASGALPRPGGAVGLLRGRIGMAAYFLAPGHLYDLAARSALDAGAVAVAAPLGDATDLVRLVIDRVVLTQSHYPVAA